MIVLKFGGTSVGTAESLYNVKKIVESLTDDAVIVVSALGGLTDKLIATAREAAAGCDTYIDRWEEMALRHYRIIDDTIPDHERAESTKTLITPFLDELKRLYQGVALISYLPGPTLDRIVSLGERMSSIIVANIINRATHVDSLEIIKTEKYFDKNIASANLTDKLISRKFQDINYPVVMGGFISSDKDTGEITNLGRGGSDFTAALVAASLNADVLQIWTDVDGFLTTDPRVVKDAKVISEMSFVESMDLCTFGAKVIYPPTIYPVFHKNIPIRILNTHNPEAPGTLICDKPQRPSTHIAGISALKDQSLILIKGVDELSYTPFTTRAFNALSRKGLSGRVHTIPGASDVLAMLIPTSDAASAVKLLNDEFAPELSRNELTDVTVCDGLSALAIVGDNIRQVIGLNNLMLNLLNNSGIRVEGYSDKGSETTISYIVSTADADRGLNILHTSLFASAPIPSL